MPATADSPLPAYSNLPALSSAQGPRPAEGALARSEQDGALAGVRAVSWLLDRAYLDPIMGFFLPGLGDVVGAVVGTYTIGVALRMGVAPIVVARMLMNLAFDAAIGLVPFVGDVGDVAFRAHRRNLALLTDRAPARQARPSDWLLVVGAFALFFAVLVLVVWGMIRLVGALL